MVGKQTWLRREKVLVRKRPAHLVNLGPVAMGIARWCNAQPDPTLVAWGSTYLLEFLSNEAEPPR